jgi:hypothetical protein
MKRILISAVLFPIYLTCSITEPKTYSHDLSAARSRYDYERFTQAIIYVESRGNQFAVGNDNDRGIFQITPIRLQDFNNRTGKHYSHDDCFDPVISREIFDYYSRDIPFEEAARRWNGGPDGMAINSTIEYWKKVNSQL